MVSLVREMPMDTCVSGQQAQRRAYVTLVLISLFCLAPFFWVLLAAFDPKASQFLALPESLTLAHFHNLLTNESGVRWIMNSVVIIGSATVLTPVLAVMRCRALRPGGSGLCCTPSFWCVSYRRRR